MISPSSAERLRLRSIVSILGGGTPPDLEGNWGGEVPFVTPPDLRAVHGGLCSKTSRSLSMMAATMSSTVAPRGAVVVSKRAPIGYVACLGMDAAFNQGCLVLVPRNGRIDARYLTWALSVRAEDMQLLGRGTTFMEISAGDLANLTLWVPAPSLQRDIADYLDRETGKIDVLIVKQLRLVETLRERHQGLLSQLVDRSDPLLPLRRSLLNIRQGWSPNCEPEAADGIGEWGVLKTGATNGGVFAPWENKRLPSKEVPRPDLAVRQGEVVISRASSRDYVGSAACVMSDYPRLMLSDLTYGIEVSREKLEPQYLALALASRRARWQIESAAKGTSPSMQKLSQGDLGSLLLWMPTLDQQQEVIRQIEDDSTRIKSAIGKIQRFIALARERRSALITAAVTGQIDVREAS